MTPEPLPSLRIEGELTAETNGVVTTLNGSGSLLRWDLVDAAAALKGRSVGDRRALGRLGGRLREVGVTVVVHDGVRPLLEVGDVRSPIGRFVFGSSAVRPRSLLRLFRLAFAIRS